MRMRQFVAALFVILAPVAALAQVTTGSIYGVVTDESKAVLPGATVQVTNTQTGAARALVSGRDGIYRAFNLTPGTYTVTAELPGFAQATRDNITVNIGRDVAVDILLTLGAVSEQVTVSGATSNVELSSAVVAGVVTTQQIAELPLNGRSFMQLATLQPGVAVSRGTGREFAAGVGNTQLSIGGARPEMTGYLLEGTNIADIADKAPSSMAGVLLGVDAVQEFSVQTHGYSAEFGRAAGGVISAVTKSGTNAIHGTAFEFHRNSALDARNSFDQGDKPPFTRHQFGGTAGGPILRNKLFYFGSFEGLRERLSSTIVALLPNQDAHNGFLPDGRGGRTFVGVDPRVKPYFDLLYPIPTGRDYGDGTAELSHVEKNPTDEDFFVGKIDWQIGANDSASLRVSSDKSNLRQGQEHPLFVDLKSTDTRYFTAQQQHIFKSNLLNVVRGAANITKRGNDSLPTIDIPKELYFTTDPHWGALTIGGVSQVGTTASVPALYDQTLLQLNDALTWSTTKHTMKFGVDLQRYQFDGYSYSRYGGEYRFRSLQEFMTLRRSATALADRFTGNLPGSGTERSMRQTYAAFFAQDDFRISTRLSVSYGVRYEFVTAPYDKEGRVPGLLRLEDLESGPLGVTPNTPVFNPPQPWWSPRVGFAWKPFGDEKTSVRGGFGIFTQPLTTSYYRGTVFRTFPYFAGVDIRQPNVFGPAVKDLLNQGTGLAVQKRSEFIIYDAKQPYVAQFNLNLQREFAGGIVGEVGYIGSRGNDLPFYGDPNSVPAELTPDGRWRVVPGAQLRYPSWGRIRTRINTAKSFYDGLITSVNRRFAAGLMLQASYTFAKSIDDWSGGLLGGQDFDNGAGSATNWWCATCERGLSNFDVRHTLVFNGVYQLPFGKDRTGIAGALAQGWQLGVIVNMASGIPFTPYIGFDRAGDLQSDATLQKPDLAPGRKANSIIGSPDNWFDATAFVLPAAGYYGNVGRNTITGPNLRTVDLSVFKNIRIGARTLQFRGEGFNILNRANFATPNIVDGLFNPDGSRRPSATRITRTATTSRQIQLGVKLLF